MLIFAIILISRGRFKLVDVVAEESILLRKTEKCLIQRLCVRLYFFGIKGLHKLKLKVLYPSLCLLQVYAPNAMGQYQVFVDEVNNALLRSSLNESRAFIENFIAHV